MGARDDLMRVHGIGPAIAEKLVEAGISSLLVLAHLTEDDADRIAEDCDFRPRTKITDEQWIAQARQLLDADAKAQKAVTEDVAAQMDAAEDTPDDEPPEQSHEDEAVEAMPAQPMNGNAAPFPPEMFDAFLAEMQRRGMTVVPVGAAAAEPALPKAPAANGNGRGRALRRINKNRHYSEIMGHFPAAPGAMYEQVVAGEHVYFNADMVEIAEGADHLPVEPPRFPDDEDFHPKNWLAHKADYPLAMVRRYVKTTFQKNLTTEAECRRFLHSRFNQPQL